MSVHLFSFLVLQFAGLHMTLLLDALTFHSFVLVAFLPKEKEAKVQERKRLPERKMFSDIKDGIGLYLAHQKRFVSFSLLVASIVNFFCGFWFLLPFSDVYTGLKGLCDHFNC